jgi:hypothetical protein
MQKQVLRWYGFQTALVRLFDIFLLFGIMGIYSFQHQQSRSWRFFGFLLAIVGIAIIRTGSISGVNLYPIGASIFTVGMSLFAVGSWIASDIVTTSAFVIVHRQV